MRRDGLVVRRQVTARRPGTDASMSATAGFPSPWLVAYGFTLRPVRSAATGGRAFFIPGAQSTNVRLGVRHQPTETTHTAACIPICGGLASVLLMVSEGIADWSRWWKQLPTDPVAASPTTRAKRCPGNRMGEAYWLAPVGTWRSACQRRSSSALSLGEGLSAKYSWRRLPGSGSSCGWCSASALNSGVSGLRLL